MNLHYQEYGDTSAPLMVFLHGGGVSGWMWDKQVHYFSHFHCLVPDLPGHGKSIAIPFSIENSAERVVNLIEEKSNGKKVILIGFSLGAQIIVQLLSMKPNLIDCAIINSALVRPMTYAMKWIQPTIKLSAPLIKKRWFSKLQAKTLYVSDNDFEKYYEESSQITADALTRVLEENMSFTIPANFKEVTTNILVTVGEKEKSIMKQSAKDLVKANQHAKGVLIPNMGHGLSMARPNFFNHMVETWINEGAIPEESKKYMEE
ncbi:alpha/beta fold hydrolase [Bacillus sp. REN16]|uniref:alpha/beta fold hydrolase n=1 Tax=Bacillus sp. REN16 TaxID=2887296 RepID=UPI001E527745|nr:alpha/beta hydrolase [Bacillus sp. REN16]MCC3356057.1 alpha/beta hydrolase [Bacillus sp. REN16]